MYLNLYILNMLKPSLPIPNLLIIRAYLHLYGELNLLFILLSCLGSVLGRCCMISGNMGFWILRVVGVRGLLGLGMCGLGRLSRGIGCLIGMGRCVKLLLFFF